MKVGWLLDGDMFPHYREELIASIRSLGHDVKLVQPPSPPYRWDDLDRTYRNLYPADACVIAHGDIELVSGIAKEHRWTPGAFATIKNFFCSNYYCRFGSFLLNRDYIMLPFGELARCREFLTHTVGRNGRIFVRPDSPLKLFTGQVAASETFDADLEYMAFYDVPPEAIVVVSSPRTITTEWRFVVANKGVVAGCQYKRDGKQDCQPTYAAGAHALAKSIAASDYQPDPAWVLDICQTDDGEYHLLEIGGFSFADLYACNKADIVAAVSRAAIETWQQRQEQEPK
ncbi:MAG TPA: ATP-grasp domain-containing protein [Lacipirellulaceae bacterium]|nr:ATP-grasp domain-containing protein [Lacipirellulaceae bacterium]